MDADKRQCFVVASTALIIFACCSITSAADVEYQIDQKPFLQEPSRTDPAERIIKWSFPLSKELEKEQQNAFPQDFKFKIQKEPQNDFDYLLAENCSKNRPLGRWKNNTVMWGAKPMAFGGPAFNR